MLGLEGCNANRESSCAFKKCTNNDVTILYNAPGANLKRYAARAIPEISTLKKNV